MLHEFIDGTQSLLSVAWNMHVDSFFDYKISYKIEGETE